MTVAGLRHALRGLKAETPVVVVVDGMHYDLHGQAEAGLSSAGRVGVMRLLASQPTATQTSLLLVHWETLE